MSNRQATQSAVLPIFFSFFIAFILTAMPLPDVLTLVRPEWVCIVVFYWALYLPYRFGISMAWLVGILLDVLEGNMLGIQALSLSVTAYIALVIHQRLKLYPFPHQSLVIFLVVALNLAAVHWIQGLFGIVSSGYSYLLPALSSAFIWTLVALLLLGLQKSLRL